MKPHLTDGELWVLRYIERASEPGGSCAQIRRNNWLPGGLPASLQEAKERPRTAEEALKHAHALEDYSIVEALSWHTGGGDLRILGAGRQWLWDHDHPDILAVLYERARRHKMVAWGLIAYFVLGAAGGLMALALKVAALIKNLV